MNTHKFRLFNFVYFKSIHPHMMLKSFQTTYEIIKWTFFYAEIKFLKNSNVKTHIHFVYFHIFLFFYFIFTFWNNWNISVFSYIHSCSETIEDGLLCITARSGTRYSRVQICRTRSPAPEIAVITISIKIENEIFKGNSSYQFQSETWQNLVWKSTPLLFFLAP